MRSTAAPAPDQLWTKAHEEGDNPTMEFYEWVRRTMLQVLGPGEYTSKGKPIKGFHAELLTEALTIRLGADTKIARARQDLANKSPFATVKGSLETKDAMGKLNLLLGFCLSIVSSPLARAQAGSTFHQATRQPGEDIAAFGQRLLMMGQMLGLKPDVLEEFLYAKMADRKVLAPATAGLKSGFWLAYNAKLEAHGVTPDSSTTAGTKRAQGEDSFRLRVMLAQAAYEQVYLDDPELAMPTKKTTGCRAAAVAGASTDNDEFLEGRGAKAAKADDKYCNRCGEHGHIATKCTLAAATAAAHRPQQAVTCKFCKKTQQLHLPYWCPKNPREGGDWARHQAGPRPAKRGPVGTTAGAQKELVAAVLAALAAGTTSTSGRKTQRRLMAGAREERGPTRAAASMMEGPGEEETEASGGSSPDEDSA